MTQVAKAAGARWDNDGGFLLYRQLDSAKLKAEAWKVFDLPGWYGISPKENKTGRGTSTLNEWWKTSENSLMNWSERGKSKEHKHLLNPHHVAELSQGTVSISSHLFILMTLWDIRWPHEIRWDHLHLASEKLRNWPIVTQLVWAGTDTEQSHDSGVKPPPLPRCFLENLEKKYPSPLQSVRLLNYIWENLSERIQLAVGVSLWLQL